jgi:uncharacterized membrane protein
MEDVSTIKVVKTIYVLYLIGFIFPICSLIGLVMAYVYRDDAKDYLKGHFHYQIRGFWIYLLYSLISLVLCVILIGGLLFLVTAVWWIIRNIKGFRAASQGVSVVNPRTWWF